MKNRKRFTPKTRRVAPSSHPHDCSIQPHHGHILTHIRTHQCPRPGYCSCNAQSIHRPTGNRSDSNRRALVSTRAVAERGARRERRMKERRYRILATGRWKVRTSLQGSIVHTCRKASKQNNIRNGATIICIAMFAPINGTRRLARGRETGGRRL